ncbi:MAG TPA: hypothetical protein VF469_06675 [Kofleriaceae bacterium]
MAEFVRTVLTLAFTTVAATGCSLVLDSNGNQCSVDTDCAHFGGHPVCREGTCVASGLGPPDCFFGNPQTQDNFANQCTLAQTYQFDNCARLGLCTSDALTTSFGVRAVPVDLGTAPPPVFTQAPPTTLCSDVSSNIIYVTGSTNLPPLLKAVQPLLYASHDPGVAPFVVVFAPQTSCKGAAAVYDPATSKHLIFDVSNNYAFYFDQSGNQVFCKLAAAGNIVDVGESDVYPSSCGYDPQSNVADYTGPIQAITFVVPSSSKQTSISAEAAHLVFAAGGNGGKAAPWTDPSLYFVRSSGTGTVQLPSRALDISPTAWWGIDRLSASNLVASMEALDPTRAEGAIGILSSDFADKNRANLRELAFQQRGEKYAYLVDSSPESLDKANVRDGHYPIWGAIHLLAATVNGVPSDAARALITQFSVAKLDESLVSAIIDAGFVPQCAMKVTHSSEVGPLSTYKPSFACGCFFDKKVNGTTDCRVCSVNSDCATGSVCNYGFCEKS